MEHNDKPSRILGFAFLFQFMTSLFNGAVLQPAWLVSGDVRQTLMNIASHPILVRASLLVDMLTALGIIFLGAILYETLIEQNRKIALVALGFYIMEAVLLASSRLGAFSLIGIAREYQLSSQPANWLGMGNVAIGSMNFTGSTLHMLSFCSGGILFYYLLYHSRLVPPALSLWGLITVIPCLAGTLAAVFGVQVPIYFYAPYVPFELVIAIWILVKGIHREPRPVPNPHLP